MPAIIPLTVVYLMLAARDTSTPKFTTVKDEDRPLEMQGQQARGDTR